MILKAEKIAELQAEIDRLKSMTYCACCGKEFPLDDEAAIQFSEHILTCDKHPLRELEAESDRRLALLRQTHDDAKNHGHCPSCCMEGTGFSLFDWKYQSYVHAAGCKLVEEVKENHNGGG